MTICQDCSVDFYRLDGGTCGKCTQLDGKPDFEKAEIQKRPQCLSCGLVYTNLQNPLCNPCASVFGQAESVPRSILNITGAADQIQIFEKSDLTSEIWSLAYQFKQTASDSRLGKPRTQNANLQKTPSGAIQAAKRAAANASIGVRSNLTKVQDMRGLGKDVRMKASLTAFDPHAATKAKKLVDIPQVNVSYSVPETKDINSALDELVLQVQQCHQRMDGAAAKIYRHMVTFHAVESATKTYFIPEGKTREGTVSDFLSYFRTQKHITENNYKDKVLDIKLVVKREDIFPEGVMAAPMSAFVASAVPRGRNSSLVATRTASSSSSSIRASSRASIPPLQSAVRVSAWRRRAPQFSRNPPRLLDYQFKRYTVESDGVNVKLSVKHSAKLESISIALDWKTGLEKCSRNEDFSSTGFIGHGSSKNVVYARVGNLEYALAQPHDETLTEHQNRDMLEEEMRNLHFGKIFLAEFHTSVKEADITIPAFRFNTEGAILGVLQPFGGGDTGADSALPFVHFLATPYLHRGPADPPIEKFTGNDDCGPPPTSALTTAIHSFTHFMIGYTQGEFVLCDLQGMYNRDGVMILIDPQSHSSEANPIKRTYWDKGPKAIEHFLRHHLEVCGNNHVCKRLCLETAKFVTRDDLDLPIPDIESSDDENTLPTPARLVEGTRALSLSPQNPRKRARTAATDVRGPPLRFGFPEE